LSTNYTLLYNVNPELVFLNLCINFSLNIVTYSTRSKANVFQFAICKTFYLVQTLKRVNLILKLKPKL